MIIDVHHHYYVAPRPIVEFKSAEQHLKDSKKAGINILLLQNSIYSAGPQNPKLAEEFNQKLFDITRQYPSKILGLGSVPLPNGNAAKDELERCYSRYEMKGVVIRPYKVRIDYEELWPFYEKASNLGMPVFTHPVAPHFPEVFDGYDLTEILWFMFNTTTVALRAIYSGLLEDFPRLKLVFPHCGGTLPFLIGRAEAALECAKTDPIVQAKITKPPTHYFRQLYFDTISYHKEALMCLYATADPEKLLFGTDHPYRYFGEMEPHVERIRSLPIPESAKRGILGENARRLLGL